MNMNITMNNIYNKKQDFKVPAKIRTEEATKLKTSHKDDFSISRQAQDLQTANNVARNTPDIRENKVNEIKELIKSGKYEIDFSKIADKILG